ncbi:MAG: nuclear transport factor 2 family protein [Pseudomonadota bacterium]
MTDKGVKPEDVLPDGDDFATIKGVRVRKGSIAASMRNMAMLESGSADEKAAAMQAIKDLAPGLAALDVHRFFQCRIPKIEAILAEAAEPFDDVADPEPESTVAAFIAAFDRADLASMEALLAADAVSYITNADGGVNRLEGSDALMESVRAMKIEQVNLSVAITQTARVGLRQVMAMVEIKAERKGRSLHNHAAFLMTVHERRIDEIRMVEALPAYSDSFWKE